LTKAPASLLECALYISARKKLIHAMPLNTDQPISRATVAGCAISATAQLFAITRANKIKSPLLQHSCQNAKVVHTFEPQKITRHSNYLPDESP
jgi:hypothetical protein